MVKPKDSAYEAAIILYTSLKMLDGTRVLVDKALYCILFVT